MHHAHISDLPWQEKRSPTGKFHSYCCDLSLALGGLRNVGTWGGGHPFDVQIRRVPPGASICPFHSHLVQWELFYVQKGSGFVRAGRTTCPVGAGNVFIHPPGEAHQLTNSGESDLEVLIVADNPEMDGCYYPDSNKWGLRTPSFVFRANQVDYFDGEDQVVQQPSGTHPTPKFPPHVDPNFAQRNRHLDDIPWESWGRAGKLHGTSKEVSIALGAKPNTPTGLGGHPFDFELNRFAPGECGCPLHSHAAQWELFLILSGQASVRAGDKRYDLGAGDVCLHPPREPHQICNSSASENLVFLLIADNPPVDYWYYPDSKKWGIREPRMFFRPEPLDYYDGEI